MAGQVTQPEHRTRAATAAVGATMLGLANAAVSAFWLAGGTALLDTVGGSLERAGRERPGEALVLLAGVTVAKVVVAVSALAYARILPARALRPVRLLAAGRPGRALGWAVAGVLVAYGGVLTAAGLAVETGLVAVEPADPRALRWHALLWDPWFLAWGSALAATLWWSRERPPTGTESLPDGPLS